jgi:hypothetical protein
MPFRHGAVAHWLVESHSCFIGIRLYWRRRKRSDDPIHAGQRCRVVAALGGKALNLKYRERIL